MKVPKQCIKSCDEAEYLEKEDLTLLIIGSGLLGKIGKNKPESFTSSTRVLMGPPKKQVYLKYTLAFFEQMNHLMHLKKTNLDALKIISNSTIFYLTFEIVLSNKMKVIWIKSPSL